jgi:hypothetical protein
MSNSPQNYKTFLLDTLQKISDKFPDKWQSSASQDCFVLFLEPKALMICDFFDSLGRKNIDISQLDENGSITSNLKINQSEEPDLYTSVFNIYQKIKEQVKINNVQHLNGILNSELSSGNFNYQNL